jgi:E3 ubiquitin-protein ligase UHRF1
LRTAPQSKDQTLTRYYSPLHLSLDVVIDRIEYRGNAALALNCDNGKPVRVIRGFKLDSPYAPASGYRYDGLYDVKKYWSETGLSGFLVWKFALVRCPDQESAPWEEDEGENNNNNINDDNSDANNNVDNNENQEASASEVIQTKKEEEKKEPEKLGLCISL